MKSSSKITLISILGILVFSGCATTTMQESNINTKQVEEMKMYKEYRTGVVFNVKKVLINSSYRTFITDETVESQQEVKNLEIPLYKTDFYSADGENTIYISKKLSSGDKIEYVNYDNKITHISIIN